MTVPPSAALPSRPLLVSHTAAPGGSNEVLLALLSQRPAAAVPACIFLAPGETEMRARMLGVPTAVVRAGRGRQLWRLPRVIGELRGAIRAHEADLVFAHTAKAHLYAAVAASLEGVPYLWWQHALPGQERLLDAVADRLPAAAVICNSDFTATLQRARTPGMPVHRIHGGTVMPDPAELRSVTSATVGIVGRLQRWKRVELLLHAVPEVLRSVPEARFVVVGGGDPAVDADYPAELKQLAELLGITHVVVFTGHVHDAPRRIGQFDVLAHTADREPFGLVFLEAMARAVPVVAPLTGGSAEIVRDGIDGLLVDVTDSHALASAITALLRDPDRRATMGAAGRKHVCEHFTLERMTDQAWDLAARVCQRERVADRRSVLRPRP